MDTPLGLPARIDALPEYMDYADTGCSLYAACLACPLPRCRYDAAGGAAAILRSGRDASIVRLARQDGLGVDQLAAMFGLSRRTIFRVLEHDRRRA